MEAGHRGFSLYTVHGTKAVAFFTNAPDTHDARGEPQYLEEYRVRGSSSEGAS